MTVKGIDVHCHVILMDNPDDVVKESMNKIRALINIATDIEEAKQSLELSKKYPKFVFSSAGIHPEGAASASGKEIDEMLQFIKDNRKNLVSIGEVGIDYFWVKEQEKRRRAEDAFIQFIELSNQLKKPLQIHARNSEEKKTAFSDALKLLTDNNARSVVMHS
ncbi:MAG: TatD family hydrolase, partial [Candidatus Aenigmarchaeota archaeon]|nr:TatD family hydrolase [Candidatus Aenigmarchaeota archaeon]